MTAKQQQKETRLINEMNETREKMYEVSRINPSDARAQRDNIRLVCKLDKRIQQLASELRAMGTFAACKGLMNG